MSFPLPPPPFVVAPQPPFLPCSGAVAPHLPYVGGTCCKVYLPPSVGCPPEACPEQLDMVQVLAQSVTGTLVPTIPLLQVWGGTQTITYDGDAPTLRDFGTVTIHSDGLYEVTVMLPAITVTAGSTTYVMLNWSGSPQPLAVDSRTNAALVAQPYIFNLGASRRMIEGDTLTVTALVAPVGGVAAFQALPVGTAFIYGRWSVKRIPWPS